MKSNAVRSFPKLVFLFLVLAESLVSPTRLSAQPPISLPKRAIYALGSSWLTHHDSVVDLRLFPNGRILASRDLGNKVMLWDLDKYVVRPLAPGLSTSSISVCPTGRTLAAVLDSFELALFDTTTLTKRARMKFPSPLGGLEFSPRSNILALVEDGKLKLLDPAVLKVVQTIELENDEYESVVFSSDGKLAAAATEGKWVVLLNISTKKVETKIGPFESGIASVAWTDDSKRLAIATVNGAISLWSIEGRMLASAKITFRYSEEHSSWLPVLFISDSLMVSGDRDGFIRFWDDSLREVARVNAHFGYVNSLVVSRDRRTLYSGGGDYQIKCWDVKDRREKRVSQRLPGLVGTIAANSKTNLLAVSTANVVSLWALDSGKDKDTREAFEFHILDMAFSPSGQLFAACTSHARSSVVSYCTLKIWNTKNKKEVFSYANPNRKAIIPCLKMLSDHEILFAEIGEGESFLQLWDFRQKKLIFEARSPGLLRFDVSPDGKWIAGAGLDGPIHLIDAKSGQVSKETPGHDGFIRAILFSGKGDLISAGEDKVVKVWKLQENGLKAIGALAQQEPVKACSISPKGDRLAVGCESGEILIWDLEKRKQIMRLAGHTGAIKKIEFVDEERLVSAALDNTCVLWSIKE